METPRGKGFMRIMAQHECRGKWKIGEETGSTLFLRGYEYRY
jgi:hypothetical protein